MKILLILFWLCVFLVVYTYVGYGILLFLLVKIRRIMHPVKKLSLPEELPDVTLLICAYNEEDIIQEKMSNCHALNYPKGKLHLIWCTDGSNDHTNERLNAYPDVQILFEPARMGKTAALNRSIPYVQTPIVVFTDANTILNADCLLEIVKCFTDEHVGCVSGEKRILVETSDGLAAGGEGAYWKYESTLKKWDSELCSTMGAAGELFAIRTNLFEPIDVNMLLDDFIMSMRIVQRGYKIAYCREAYACERGSASMQEEQKRKQRIAAGGLQSIWQLRGMMNPFRYGIISFQLISHRFLRWSIAPIALFALIPLNIVLIYMHAGMIYTIIWVLQLAFYALALMNVRIPSYFVFMNLNVFRGMRYLIKKRPGTGAWEKAKRL